MSENSSTRNYDLRTTPKVIFESLTDGEKAKQWFPGMAIIKDNEEVNIKQLEIDGIEYITRIKQATPYSSIIGTIESLDGRNKQDFEWTISPNESVKKWSRLTTKTIEKQKNLKWISPLPAVGAGVGIIAFLENGFLGLSTAYGATSLGTAAVSSSSVVAAQTTSTGTASKSILAAITISTIIAAGGGIITYDAYYSEPIIEFDLEPKQLPAELHGTSLIIENIISTDDKSKIKKL